MPELKNRKREMFCQEYVANGYNAQEAFRKIYADHPNSARLMKEPEVKARIDELIHEKYEELHISAERIAEKLAEMAFAAKDDEVYGPSVALKALDMLQKQLGLQTKNVNATVDGPTTIQVKINKKETENDETHSKEG